MGFAMHCRKIKALPSGIAHAKESGIAFTFLSPGFHGCLHAPWSNENSFVTVSGERE
jgi:hypothetical protein